MFYNEDLSRVVGILLGAFFVYASLDKIYNYDGFLVSILNYRIVPLPIAHLSATILPWLELIAGMSIISGIYRRGGALLISAMMLMFTLAVLSAILRNLDISCGCFTQGPAAAKIGWTKILENTTLFIIAIFLFVMSVRDRSKSTEKIEPTP